MFKLSKRLISDGKSFVQINANRHYQSVNVFGYVAKRTERERAPLENEVLENVYNNNCKFHKLVEAYRKHGHLIGNVNPIALNVLSAPKEIEPKRYGLADEDIVKYSGIINAVNNRTEGSVTEATEFLKTCYTEYITAEFMHLESGEEIAWFSQQMESIPRKTLDKETKIQTATELLKSQTLDHFLAAKFPGLKRYGGEGAECMMAFFLQLFKQSNQEDSLEQIVLCMPHRGRLNLLTGMLNFPPVRLFKKLRGLPDFPDCFKATGDVISHCISKTQLGAGDGKVRLSLLYNPSHLEAVNPVSMGKTRAKQLSFEDGHYSGSPLPWSSKVLNVQVHGDAAYIGQGVNQECLALSKVPHFEIGGSVHLIVNNQVGFTTPAHTARSSRYCTDLAKMIDAPVIHVNGTKPESVLHATELAVSYQRRFRKEVFLDVNCYRQWGHNELDDPTFTNPKLYKIIKNLPTVPDSYAAALVAEGVLSEGDVAGVKEKHRKWLDEALQSCDGYKIGEDDVPCFRGQWAGFRQADFEKITQWNTGSDLDLLKYIGAKSVAYPEGFVRVALIKLNPVQ